MTRKCVLCKDTNYKNPYSFFSAPKDEEVRKKWKEAIPIANYTVTDETYVCSKHFLPGDIITHWASGVAPHIVTIKYKKCRLRPGAIPATRAEIEKAIAKENSLDDDCELEVNRNWGDNNTNIIFDDNSDKIYQIPRNDKILTYPSGDYHNVPRVMSLPINNTDIDEEKITLERLKSENEDSIISDQLDDSEYETIEQDTFEHEETVNESNTIYLKPVNSQILYVETVDDNHDKTEYIEEEIIDSNCTKDRFEEYFPPNINSIIENHDEDDNNDDGDDNNYQNNHEEIEDENQFIEESEQEIYDYDKLDDDDNYDNDEGSNVDIFEHIKTEKNNQQIRYEDEKSQDSEYVKMDTSDPLDFNEECDEERVLFEDLIENYSEIELPTGWFSMFDSKGRDTTLICAFFKTTNNGIPWIEKQVFLQRDMILRCSAAGKEIDPFIYNFITEGRQSKVYSLRDITEMVKEFDSRVVCKGSFEKISPADLDNTIAYQDGYKWRHVNCLIIVNNDSERCSRCSALKVLLNRRKPKKPPQTAASAELLKKERTIFVLQKLLKKKSRKNKDNYEIMKNRNTLNHDSLESENGILRLLDIINIPDIQKVMIRECLKAPMSINNSSTEYSESWIFLSLCLYMESSKLYKYLLQKKYMSLPSIKEMKRYLNQIETDPQFYTLFQRSIEPFGFNCEPT